ncbi:MAG: IS4 family transposase [Patescibacteria group bacterium]
MNENIKNVTINQLANMLFIPQELIQSLMVKHNLVEKRKRIFFFADFLFACFWCLFHGVTRHQDRKSFMKRLFNVVLSNNAMSDRLSAIPSAFFSDLLKIIQPQINQIPSKKKREQVKLMVRNILIEDASIFKIDNRLESIFKNIPGCKSAGLKLYLSYNIFDDNNLSASIKHARFSDMKKTGKKTKQTIEIRDRGWFSWQNLCNYQNDGKYYISRIQRQVNPLITKVYKGDPAFIKQKFQSLNLDGYSEVDFEIKPFRDSSGSIYRLADDTVFTLRMKGKKQDDGWYWYVMYLPNVDDLSFSDVHALYRVRWQIEEMFREIKQAFGGDRLRLRNENSVINHIYMMLISYLVCKCFLRVIADVNHKSPSGFMLDTCMKGSLRHEFLSIVFHLIKNPLITKQQLHNISKYFCECTYSPHRANSSRKSRLNRVMRKFEVPSNE